ncbi:pyruvate, water dikinase [Ruminococcaceae bacterium YRB3002]|nr:pyruvate, water dikinase [Ruminococcaceae bacterium YRB3002]
MYGSKADNLIRLRDNGINVPEFIVIPYDEEHDLSSLIPDGRYAVRSCCSAEDAVDASFAGQFDTYLNVAAPDVPARVAAIRGSFAKVEEYSRQKGIDISAAKMNVIVQKMVDAELSGVMFTANPQGLLNESVITVGRGLGEGVVSDKVDTTSYYYNLTDKIYYYDGREDLLSNSLVECLISTSVQIKELLGEYLDIEFAIADGKIYILQARPITTLKTDDPLILDNSNIVESYPGISLPLTVSFVDLVYSGVFKGVCRRVLKNDKELDKHSDVFLNMTGHANGRVYYKISNWYTVLKFLPFSKKIIPVWQEMLGVKNKNYDKDDVKVPFFTRVATYFNSVYELLRVPKNMKKLNDLFLVINGNFYDTFRDDMTPVELKALFDEIKVKLFDVWDVTLLNDMYTFIYTGLVKSRLKKKGRTEEEINNLISGISDLHSMMPIRTMVTMAYIKDNLTEEHYNNMRKLYIKEYGDRSLEELKLESRTYRTNPELLDKMIESYRKDPVRLAETRESIMKPRDSERPGGLTGHFLKKASLGIANREISRLNRSRIYGIVRLIFDTVAKSYVRDGIISDETDIYYLTVDEIWGLTDTPSDMKGIVAERKEEYELYKQLPAYSRLIFSDREFDKSHLSVNSYRRSLDDCELAGTPCSSGVIEGEAVVINNVNDAEDIDGKILVTKMTDPGWVFLLARAAGVISEKGSLLSHTAIISRELKVPSVVGVPGLLDTVSTGDVIRMDGSTGKIEILQRSR